jgi:hypothetical protein
MFCNNPQEIFSENEGCWFQIFYPKHQTLKEILLSERERERAREREKVGKQTAEWQQASSAAIAQTISVRGTKEPSEETYSESA